MGRVKGIVVKVEPPRTAAPQGMMLVTISVPKRYRWTTPDGGKTWEKIPMRVYKPVRFQGFYKGSPRIGERITLQIY